MNIYKASILIFVVGFAGAAQADDTVPTCVTSFDAGGEMAAGYGSIINAPVAFDAAQSTANAIETFGGTIRTETGFLSFGYRVSEQVPVTITFRKENSVVYECQVSIINFEVERHSIEQLGYGACGTQSESVILTVQSGETRSVEMDGEPIELMASPRSVLSATPEGGQTIEVIANDPGVGQFTWLSRHDGTIKVSGLCPVIVADSP